MRCLGIPNTDHFANITSIEDALSLWNKLKNNKDDERWKPEVEVSIEIFAINDYLYLNLFRKNLKIQWVMSLINEHMMIFGNKVFYN